MSKGFAAWIALGVEAGAALIVCYGAIEAFYGIFRIVAVRRSNLVELKQVWVRFGVWLLLGLEFELAADIVRTAISPTWVALGQLAAIAVIRTFLNYFLEKELETYVPSQGATPSKKDIRAAA